MTAAAEWLNTVFHNFDYSVLEAFHNLHDSSVGVLLEPFFNFISLIGEKGIFLIIISSIMLLFKKTRKVGAVMLGGIAIGGLITNITVKPFVDRPRPYANREWDVYQWWINAGRHMEIDSSFPSGHTTSVTGAMTGLFFTGDKRYSWTAFFFALLMGMSRIFLCVHYPSDVFGGYVAGFTAGLISALIGNWFYKRDDLKFNKMIIELDFFKSFKKSK